MTASSDRQHAGTSPIALAAGELQSRYLRIQGWRSRYLPYSRDIFLYLPEAYHRHPERSFPALLLQDGQNLFDGQISYVKGSTWCAGSTADEAIAQGLVEPLILIGVANAGVDRIAEYTPTSDPRLGGGKGPLYARMLIEELLPQLRLHFRLLPPPEHMGIAGSSLGGLISLAIALSHPQTFGKVGVLSPSLWWSNRAMLQTVASLRAKPDLKIWLDMGAAEGTTHVRDTEALSRLLLSKGWQLNRDLAFNIVPGGVHAETAWAARFGQVLEFLFPS